MKRFVIVAAATLSLSGLAAPLADAAPPAITCPDSYSAIRTGNDPFLQAIDKNGNRWVCHKINNPESKELVVDDKA